MQKQIFEYKLTHPIREVAKKLQSHILTLNNVIDVNIIESFEIPRSIVLEIHIEANEDAIIMQNVFTFGSIVGQFEIFCSREYY